MTYLILARKYRPQVFEDILGQDHTILTLRNAILNNRVAHSVLLSGPRGTGKTTIARVMAKAMNCRSSLEKRPCNKCELCISIIDGKENDTFEIDAASNNSVDQIRNLRKNVRYMPANSRLKIYIIDEVHMLSGSAFNALLKTLEEPPSHVMFILATTEYHKIPSTIASRCQHYNLKRISSNIIKEQLLKICRMESVNIEPKILSDISNKSDGSMRDALNLLDQLIVNSGKNINSNHVNKILGFVDRSIMHKIIDGIFLKNIALILDLINSVYESGYDLRIFYFNILEHLRHLIILKIGDNLETLVNLPSDDIKMMKNQIKNISVSEINQILCLLSKEETYIKNTNYLKLTLEITFLKLYNSHTSLSIDKLIDNLDTIRKMSLVERIDTPSEAVTYKKEKKNASISNDITKQEGDNSENKKNNLEKIWLKIQESVFKIKPSLATLLSQCFIHEINEKSLEIEVTKNEYTFKILEKNFSILLNEMKKYFSPEIAITLTRNIKKRNQCTSKSKYSKTENIYNEIINYPLVNDGLNIFNGTIEDIKIDSSYKKETK